MAILPRPSSPAPPPPTAPSRSASTSPPRCPTTPSSKPSSSAPRSASTPRSTAPPPTPAVTTPHSSQSLPTSSSSSEPLAARPSRCHETPMDSGRYDLAIVGAGMNGSLLALAAGEAGLRTALIDRLPLKSMTEAGFDGRTTAISYTSQRLFHALGVWDDLAHLAEPILDIRISDAGHDGRISPFFLHFDHREAGAGDPPAAAMGWIVENRFLRSAILRRLAACPSV